MSEATLLQKHPLGVCDGSRPWLGPFTKECGEPNRLLIRTASNAYFPQIMSVISLPDRDETIKQAVTAAWDISKLSRTLRISATSGRNAKVKQALEGISEEEAFAEIQSRRGEGGKEEKKVRVAELETLVASKEEIGEDRPDGNFFARALPRTTWEAPWMQPIERVTGAPAPRSHRPGWVHPFRGGDTRP